MMDLTKLEDLPPEELKAKILEQHLAAMNAEAAAAALQDMLAQRRASQAPSPAP